jgi:hypothetical protein
MSPLAAKNSNETMTSAQDIKKNLGLGKRVPTRAFGCCKLSWTNIELLLWKVSCAKQVIWMIPEELMKGVS